MIIREESPLTEQILSLLRQHVQSNPGFRINEKVITYLNQNAKTFDRLAQRYRMKPEITAENELIIRFVDEEDALYTTYTFFKAMIEEKK